MTARPVSPKWGLFNTYSSLSARPCGVTNARRPIIRVTGYLILPLFSDLIPDYFLAGGYGSTKS